MPVVAPSVWNVSNWQRSAKGFVTPSVFLLTPPDPFTVRKSCICHYEKLRLAWWKSSYVYKDVLEKSRSSWRNSVRRGRLSGSSIVEYSLLWRVSSLELSNFLPCHNIAMSVENSSWIFCLYVDYRMEETVRSMLVYKKQAEQLRQEKNALTLAFEVSTKWHFH